jgi:signal transduction histidine kinase
MVALGAPFASDALSGLKNAPANPFAHSSAAPLAAVLGGTGVGSVMLIVAVPIAAVGLVLRFRRARGAVRDQLTWFVFGAVVLALSIIVGVMLDAVGHPDARANVIGTGVLAIPLATGIAMLQHRLYDVDVVIRKTVVAAVLVLVGVSVYAAVVGAFGLVAAGRAAPGPLFAIALILGLAFRPIARFARRIADRLVYGKRATPYEVLAEFSERVSETYGTDDVLPRMARILANGIGAERAVVWLRVGDRLRPAATTAGELPATIPMTADALPTFPEGDHAVEVRHQGELLGALSVRMPASDPMDRAKEQLIRDLAAQAGLVLRNVRLIEELRDSRRRLVEAQDEERRKLERNIHDGAQQQLVALSVKHRLLAGMLGTEDVRARAMVEQLLQDTNDALQNLRDLARGIYPPLLADRGLPDALAAQARKIAIPIEISTNGTGRYPQEVEAAVYFCVLEAIQNVTKYANASNTTVRIEAADGLLTFVVADDGVGFDTQAISQGTGLQGMTDRLEALGGTLAVASSPGGGTTITGRVRALAIETA